MDSDLRWFLIYKYMSKHEMYVSQKCSIKRNMRINISNSKNTISMAMSLIYVFSYAHVTSPWVIVPYTC
jgi:hypothetical protein